MVARSPALRPTYCSAARIGTCAFKKRRTRSIVRCFSSRDRLRFKALSLVGRLVVRRIAGRRSVRRVVSRRVDHRIWFDRIHTFEHGPSQASPALLRRNAAWIAVRAAARPTHRPCDLDRRVRSLRRQDFLEVLHEADCILDCHQGGLVHFRSWPAASTTGAPRGSGSGTGLALRAWRAFPFHRTAASRISRARRWRPHDS